MVGFIEIVPGKGIKYLNLNISRFFQFFGSNIKVTDIHQAFEINQEMKDGAEWQTAADETLFHPSDHNGEMIYSLIKSTELSNTSGLDNGCNHATSSGWWWPGSHVSGQISPSAGPGNAWELGPLTTGEKLWRESQRGEGAPSLRQRALSSSCVQSAGGTNESVELEQLAPNTFCIVKLEIESPIIKWHTLATKSPHQNKLTISISACYLLLEVYNEYPRGWILSISSDYLHLRQRW